MRLETSVLFALTAFAAPALACAPDAPVEPAPTADWSEDAPSVETDTVDWNEDGPAFAIDSTVEDDTGIDDLDTGGLAPSRVDDSEVDVEHVEQVLAFTLDNCPACGRG